MNGKQLKNSILQWAIQGKLVPQDPNDEPASVLLEKIRDEKVRLVKEGKIKKDKNESVIYRGDDNSHYEKFADGTIKCIDEEIPFDLPKGWEWTRLNNVASSLLGKTMDKGKNKGELKKYLCSINVYWGKIELSKIKEAKFEPKELEKYKLKQGDLLVCEGGDVGRAAVWTYDNEMYYQNALHRIRFYSGIESDYFRFILEAYKGNGLIESVSNCVTISHFTQNSMNSLFYPIPPLKEQRRIVNKLKNLYEFIELYEKSQDSLDKLNFELPERIKKSILQEAIQGRLVPQNPEDEPASKLLERIREEKQKMVAEGKLKKSELNDSVIFRGEDNKYYERIGNNIVCVDDEIPFELPQGWEWTRVCLVANMFTGNSISETEKKSKFTSVEGMNYIGTKDVTFNNTIKYNNGVNIPQKYIDSFKIAPANSILLCIEGGSAGRKIAVTNQDVCFGNKLCCFTPFHSILTKYLYFYIQSSTFHEAFTNNKTGIIGGVSVNALKKMLVAIPPLNEIVRICEKTDSLLTSIMRK